MAEVRAAVGKAIRQLRQERGWSQENLARLAGAERAYLGRVETGDRNATVDFLDRIARALGLTTWDLYRRAEEIERGEAPAGDTVDPHRPA